ncbi:MAG TPA: HDOD domain-containing protein [Pirellulales bacterium]|nr:HDOD domain-containing protein [Pirellulales bacterium]
MDEEHLVAISLLKNVGELHSLPDVARRLLEMTRLDDYEMREVAKCLEHDPALAAKVLLIANSAQFALHRPAASVQRAVALLGRRSLRLAALTFGLIGSLTDGLAKQLVDQFWRRAVLMAIAAKKLAGLAGDADPYDCYTAALLADLGVLALAQTFGEEYARLNERQTCHEQRVNEERRQFGCGHPALAACLLARWNLPGELVEAVGRHHVAPSGGGGLPNVVQHANLLAEVLLLPVSAEFVLALHCQLKQRYSLDLDGFIDLCRAVQGELQAEWQAYSVAPVATADCCKLLDAARSQYQLAAFDAALDLDSLIEPFEVQRP